MSSAYPINLTPRAVTAASLVERAVELQIDALRALQASLAQDGMAHVTEAANLILGCKGRLIVTGIGKSGHIGRKVAATFASTGTNAFFVHATEASHGDLGMVHSSDLILALSWSGETTELFDTLHFAARTGVPVIAITSNGASTLARHARVALVLPRVREICQHGLAPSSSTLVQLAMGDALAIAVSELRGFRAADFRERHPGGKLGLLLSKVSDMMTAQPGLPLVPREAKMDTSILVMTSGRFGTVGVCDDDGQLVGVITDGDIRRRMAPNFLDFAAKDVMSANPRALHPDTLASDALEYMSRNKITVVFVIDDKRPVGILHMHDLVRAGVA